MSYRSIFLDPDWLHVRHLGWLDSWPDPDFRLMRKKNGPLQRFLAVSALPSERAGQVVERLLELRRPANEITIHDLTGNGDLAAALLSLGFIELSDDRMLNRHTLVLDLLQDDPALLAAMNTDTRRKLRQAEKAGVVFISDCHTDRLLSARFLHAYNAMASERNLATMQEAEFHKLVTSGQSRLAAALSADRESACFVLTYEAGNTALFHHGASDGPVDHLLGREVHWRLAQQLRSDGFAWYDLGGLPTPDPSNGITRFKLGFGGSVVDLGREYRWSGSLVTLARTGRRFLGHFGG